MAVAAALVFAWTNGFHDASNSVATSLATGALTPRVALGLAAALNVVGGLLGVSVAQTLRRSLFAVPVGHPGVGLVIAALIAAITGNLVTWWLGLPSSSSHALIGALAGAGLAAGVGVNWRVIGTSVAVPMVVSPIVGFGLAWVVAAALLRSTRDAANAPGLRRFRLAQTVSASAVALGHGLQDAQKTAAVIVLALVAGGHLAPGAGVPGWVRAGAALALGLGTAFGGRRIVRTVGRRICEIDPLTGFAAEVVAAGSLYVSSGVFGAPVSSTYVLVASVMGGGATGGLRAIRWPQVGRIAIAFVATPVAAAALGWMLYRLAS